MLAHTSITCGTAGCATFSTVDIHDVAHLPHQDLREAVSAELLAMLQHGLVQAGPDGELCLRAKASLDRSTVPNSRFQSSGAAATGEITSSKRAHLRRALVSMLPTASTPGQLSAVAANTFASGPSVAVTTAATQAMDKCPSSWPDGAVSACNTEQKACIGQQAVADGPALRGHERACLGTVAGSANRLVDSEARLRSAIAECRVAQRRSDAAQRAWQWQTWR